MNGQPSMANVDQRNESTTQRPDRLYSPWHVRTPVPSHPADAPARKTGRGRPNRAFQTFGYTRYTREQLPWLKGRAGARSKASSHQRSADSRFGSGGISKRGSSCSMKLSAISSVGAW